MNSFEKQATEYDDLLKARDDIQEDLMSLHANLGRANNRISDFQRNLRDSGIGFRGRTAEEIARLAELASDGTSPLSEARPNYHDELTSFVDATKFNIGAPAMLATTKYQHCPYYDFSPFVIPTRPRIQIGSGVVSRMYMSIAKGFMGNVSTYSQDGELKLSSPVEMRRLNISELWVDRVKVTEDPEDIDVEDNKPILWIGSAALTSVLQRPDILLDKNQSNYGIKDSQIATIGLALRMYVGTGAIKKADKKQLSKVAVEKEEEWLEEHASHRSSLSRTRGIRTRISREGISDDAKHLLRCLAHDEERLIWEASEKQKYWQTIIDSLAV